MAPCLNKSGQMDWKREGGSISRHERLSGKHPNCSPVCPGFTKLRRQEAPLSFPSDVEEQPVLQLGIFYQLYLQRVLNNIICRRLVYI
jgi:hypothetical protein